MRHALVYEQAPELASALADALRSLDLAVVVFNDPAEARRALQERPHSLVCWPFRPTSGAEWLALKAAFPAVSFIAMGDSDDPAQVVAALRCGASHFWCREDSLARLTEAAADTLARRVEDIEPSGSESPLLPEFVGKHPRMLEIFRLVLSLRNADSTVLITGESGTGKELVARAIHALSPRSAHPWVAVNCAAIPANLLESELFGHVRGAFTGAVQNRVGRFQSVGFGTLLLDEISELPLDLQSKLLRALQQRTFEPVGSSQPVQLNARIIAATNQNLERAVEEKRFRQDLYYRLNVIPIFVPPLRERRSDIPFLARAFGEKIARAQGKPFHGFTEEAMRVLVGYHWPGNVRELENLVERVMVLRSAEGPIQRSEIPLEHFRKYQFEEFRPAFDLPDDGIDLNAAIDRFESDLLMQALRRTQGNKNRAAGLLKINRTTLIEKLKRKNLQGPRS
jgi:DNA-binding NtrC family response regulator